MLMNKLSSCQCRKCSAKPNRKERERESRESRENRLICHSVLAGYGNVEVRKGNCRQLTLKVLVATIDALGHFETG